MSNSLSGDKSLVRARALRAARAVAIFATLSGAGCSSVQDVPGADLGVAEDASSVDLGQIVADASVDGTTSSVDSSVADGAASDATMTTDARVSDSASAEDAQGLADAGPEASEPEYPCLLDGGGIDWDCCSEMGYPAGCPVIGPFVPPSMSA